MRWPRPRAAARRTPPARAGRRSWRDRRRARPGVRDRAAESERAGSSDGLVGLILEPVADAAQGLDVGPGVTQLLAQPLDVGIDRAGRDVGLDAPHVAQQG